MSRQWHTKKKMIKRELFKLGIWDTFWIKKNRQWKNKIMKQKKNVKINNLMQGT